MKNTKGCTKSRIIIPYEKHLKELARDLRNNSTLSEILLWNCLKKKQMMGYDFHRQKPLDRFIVDFFCHELILAIEIDGDSHDLKEEEDVYRQKRLEAIGVRFLRFDDRDVKNNIKKVLKMIKEWINQHAPPPDQPPEEWTP
jgi:very-short-patch-repair endonuclease